MTRSNLRATRKMRPVCLSSLRCLPQAYLVPALSSAEQPHAQHLRAQAGRLHRSARDVEVAQGQTLRPDRDRHLQHLRPASGREARSAACPRSGHGGTKGRPDRSCQHRHHLDLRRSAWDSAVSGKASWRRSPPRRWPWGNNSGLTGQAPRPPTPPAFAQLMTTGFALDRRWAARPHPDQGPQRDGRHGRPPRDGPPGGRRRLSRRRLRVIRLRIRNQLHGRHREPNSLSTKVSVRSYVARRFDHAVASRASAD